MKWNTKIEVQQNSLPQRNRRRGLSLLEVMLALVILGVAVAILAQAMQVAADSGVRSRDMMAAQLICESTMAEVVAGLTSTQSPTWIPVSMKASVVDWYYKIETLQTEQPDMVGIRVMVTDDPERTSNRPNDYQLVRWIIDPNLGLDSLPESSDQAQGGSSSATSSSGSAGGTSSGGTR